MNIISHLLCLIKHNFKVVHDNGSYIYQECTRCGKRSVIVEHLNTKLPNYSWVQHETDTI